MPSEAAGSRDQLSELDLFGAWVAAEDHFGVSCTPVARERRSPTPVQSITPGDSRSEPRASVQTPRTRTDTLRDSVDASTQTDSEVAPSAPPTPESSPTSTAVVTPLSGPTARAADVAEDGVQPEEPAASPAEATTSPAADPVEPAAASAADPSAAPTAVPQATTSAARSPDPATPFADPNAAAEAVPGWSRESNQSRVSSRPPRSRSQVGRDSYQVLWREYLALSEEQRQQQSLQRQAAAKRKWAFLRGLSVRSNSLATSPSPNTEMATPATNTIVQGTLGYDKPKGLDALMVPILCPPTDFLDLQKLTKLLVRIVIRVSILVIALSFVVIPGWLWLMRHELLQGHKGEAAALLVAGLVLFIAADAVRSAAARAESARREGIFPASKRSAYQLAPGRHGAIGAVGTPTSAQNVKPVGLAGTAAAAGASVPLAAGAAGSRAAVGAASGNVHATVNGVVGSTASVNPLVRQVKQRIIKLEQLLSGHELTEADMSPDSLENRVLNLCREVGVPFGGPGGSSIRPTLAELEQQLRALENALGVA